MDSVCEKCGYIKYSRKIEGDGLPGNILFVGDNPGWLDDSGGKIFLGDSGKILREACDYAGLKRGLFRIENIVRCAPRNAANERIGTPSEESIRLCSFNLFEDLEKLKPKLIVTLGSTPYKAFGVGRHGSISKDRGYLYEFEYKRIKYSVLPTYHPAYVARNMGKEADPSIKNDFFLDIFHASHIVTRPDINPDYSYTVLDTVESACDFAKFLEEYPGRVCLDIETDGLFFYDYRYELLTLAFTLENKKTFVLPFLHPESPFFGNDLAILKIIQAFQPAFRKTRFVGQNFVYDASWIYARFNAFCAKTEWDTMWAAHHYFYGIAPTNLEYISGYFCRLPVWKQMVDNTTLVTTPLKTVMDYNAHDSINTMYVAESQELILTKLNLLESYHYCFTRSFPTYLRWRTRGIRLNEDIRKWIESNYDNEVNSMMGPVYSSPYYERFVMMSLEDLKNVFNSYSERHRCKKWQNNFDIFKEQAWGGKLPEIGLKSNPSMNRFMIDCLGLPIISEGKKGAKFDKGAFQEYLKMYAEKKLVSKIDGKLMDSPEVGKILFSIRDARHLEYMLSGFVLNMPRHYQMWDRLEDGTFKLKSFERHIWHDVLPIPNPNYFMVYPDFDASGTSTGRASVKEPPIGGFPDEDNSPIKRIVTTRYLEIGGFIFSYDTAQTEYRVIACLSNDETMLNIYRSGTGDLHLFISSRFCHVPENEVHKSIRRLMKRASFAVCLSPDTKISLLNGTEVPIKDLVGLPEFWVYSCTPEGKIVPGHAHSARVTKTVTELCVVTLDNKEQIKCTPDHLFMLRDGSYREAKDLKPDDSLMPLYRGLTNKKDFPRQAGGYETVLFNDTGVWRPTHRVVCENVLVNSMFDLKQGKGTCHHKNRNKRDNSPENLELMTKKQHDAIHKPTLELIKRTIRAAHMRPDFQEKMRIVHRDTANRQWGDGSLRKVISDNFANPEFSKKWEETSSRVSKEMWRKEEFRKSKFEEVVCSFCGKICSGKAALGVHIKWAHKTKFVEKIRKMIEFIDCGICRKKCYGRKGLATHMRKSHKINHKVKRVEFICEETEVYDISVDTYHNFALSSGIFVHNCFGGGDDTLTSTIVDILNIAEQIKSPSVQKFMDRIRPMRGDISKIAEEVRKEFLGTFTGVANYHRESEELAARSDYIWSKTGRRRPVPGFAFRGKSKINRFVNNRVQTAASDIITPTIAVNTDIQFEERKFKSMVLLTKHDATYVDLHPAEFVDGIKISLETVIAPKNFSTTFTENKNLEDIVREYFVKWPFDWLKIPLIADPKIGISEGDPCSLKVVEDGHYVVSGTPDRFSRLMQQFVLAKQNGFFDFDILKKDIKLKDGDESVVCEFKLWHGGDK